MFSQSSKKNILMSLKKNTQCIMPQRSHALQMHTLRNYTNPHYLIVSMSPNFALRIDNLCALVRRFQQLPVASDALRLEARQYLVGDALEIASGQSQDRRAGAGEAYPQETRVGFGSDRGQDFRESGDLVISEIGALGSGKAEGDEPESCGRAGAPCPASPGRSAPRLAGSGSVPSSTPPIAEG
jgi:hypothetical protein